jgi:PAS domain S-box-containing protein
MKAKSKTKQDLLMEVQELRRRLDEIEQTRSKEILNEAELNRLASFPQLNPNSVVEVDPAGHVHYSNPAADQLFPDLRKAGLNHPFLVDLNKIGSTLNTGSRKAYVREIRIGDCWYSQRIHSVLEGERLRIYGFDVTERKQTEEALQESEQRLRQASELLEAVTRGTNVIIAAQDPDLRYTFFNAAYAAEIKQITGKDIRIGSSMAELFADQPEQLAVAEREWREALAGKTTNKRLEFGDPGRRRRVYNILHTPIRDTNGVVVGAGEVAYDITEYVQAEQQIERLAVEAENERRRLQALMESLPVGVALTDTRGGNLTSNKAFEQIWGAPRPRTESVGDYEAYKAWWSETGKPVAPEEWASVLAVQKGHAVVGQLMEIERFDGSRASVINSGAPVFDADGNIIGCAVAIQDISDLRKAERALRESEERLRRIIETSPVAIGFGNSTGRIFEANEAFYRLTGYTREEIQASQLGWERLTAPEYAEIDRQIMATLAATGSAGPYEKEYIRKDGSRVPLLLSVSKFPGRDEHIAFIVDITDRKRNEESLKKNKERFELLADTASKLLATSNPQGVVNELCQKVMTHLDCHAFFNYMVDPTKQRLHLNTCAGIPEQTAKDIEWLDYGVAVCGCAARDASRIVCENIPITPDPRTELVKSFGIKAYACHPLFSEGRVMGTLSFGTRTRTAYTEDELSLMKTVADQVATAMERIRLLREIENSRDELEMRVIERTEQLDMANASLKAERKLFYSVLETIPAYVVLLAPDYHATFANRTFLERFGESHGRRCFEFLFERSEPCETCETYTVLKTMAPHEWEWAGPDGRIYFVHDFPFTDVDGSTLILEMGIDITARKRAEDALRDASLYTRNLIEVSLDPLVTISSDGKILDVNRATELVTGVPRDELIGTDFSDYFTEPEKARQGYRQVFLEGVVRDYPLAIRHRSGKVTDVLYHATVYRNEAGGVQGVFAAARDITERKRAEEELRDKESRLRFFASKYLTAQETERRRIAAELHDSIASALAGLKFKVERTGEDMKRGQSDIQSIKDLSSSLSQTIGEVRRIMADLRPSILDDLGILPALSWFCREYEKTYSHLSVDKKIGISEEDVPNSLKTVIFRISQEAMSNVARHSEASLVDLGLHKTGDRLELTIRDNGHGFQPSEVMKGLGLSTMRERAELSGGTFTIQSTSGKGTTIRASWPLAL